MSIVAIVRLATPSFATGSPAAPARLATRTFTFGRSWRSTTTTVRPFGSVLLCTAGATNGRSAPSGGIFDRSNVIALAGRFAASGWKRTIARFGVSSHFATACWMSAGVSDR